MLKAFRFSLLFALVMCLPGALRADAPKPPEKTMSIKDIDAFIRSVSDDASRSQKKKKFDTLIGKKVAFVAEVTAVKPPAPKDPDQLVSVTLRYVSKDTVTVPILDVGGGQTKGKSLKEPRTSATILLLMPPDKAVAVKRGQALRVTGRIGAINVHIWSQSGRPVIFDLTVKSD